MKPQNILSLVAIIFSLVAVLHLVRVLLGWSARIGPLQIPLSVSWIAIIVAGIIAYASWRAMWECQEQQIK